MHNIFIYKNSVGQIYVLGKNKVYVTETNILDYEWESMTRYNKVVAFEHKPKAFKITIAFCGSDPEKDINEFFEIADYDVMTESHGELYLCSHEITIPTKEYFLRGYFVGSKKCAYKRNSHIEVEMKFFCEKPVWHRETTQNFNVLVSESTQIDLDYPHNAPHDYSSPQDTQLNNPNYADTEFRMIVYGPCTNPMIKVAGHEYRVNVSVGIGEYLVIDSTEKKIYTVNHVGITENCYRFRGRDSYVFERLPRGVSEVSWNGNFSFDIVMIEDRSEPKWI